MLRLEYPIQDMHDAIATSYASWQLFDWIYRHQMSCKDVLPWSAQSASFLQWRVAGSFGVLALHEMLVPYQ